MSPKSSPRLRITVISESTFTVRGHGVHTAFVEMVAALRARRDTDVATNSWRASDIIHIHTVGLYSLAFLLFGRGRKVVSVHVIPDSFVGSLAGARYWYRLAVWYLRWFYGRADLLVAVSEEVRQALLQQLRITKPITVIFNTVDRKEYHTTATDKRRAREQLKIGASEFVVVCSGQVQPRKRYDTFARLAREFPKFRFIWVGGIPFKILGAEAAAMEGLIAAAPPNLTTTGVLELPQVKPYYQAADVFCLPSDQENHPLAVLEAAACGLPVVLRDIPQYDSSFAGDALRATEDSFGPIIRRLHSDSEYYHLAQVGSARIADRFDSTRGAEQFMAAYRKLLER